MAIVYLTAENPHFSVIPLRADNARMWQLMHDLEKQVIYDNQVKLGQFVDNRTGYAEKVFRVNGISIEGAVFLARAWSQDRIVVEDLGDLNVHDLTYHPIRKKYTGEAAYKQGIFTIVEGMPAVSFDFNYNITKQWRGHIK